MGTGSDFDFCLRKIADVKVEIQTSPQFTCNPDLNQVQYITCKTRNPDKTMTCLSLAEFREFHFDFMKLQLHFAWNWMQAHPDETLEDILDKRIDLCRKTDPDPDHCDTAKIDLKRPAYINLRNELVRIMQETRDNDNADTFEERGFKLVKPTLAQFAKKTHGSNTKFDNYQCGSLRYDIPTNDAPETVTFHIGNAIAPKSIFYEKQYLADCFICLMNQTEEKWGANTLKTSTWLNELPKWLEYFPEEWMLNRSDPNPDIQWHYGFWGQFITARGTFNHKYGRILRETGKMPFLPRQASCSFKSMREHLAKITQPGTNP